LRHPLNSTLSGRANPENDPKNFYLKPFFVRAFQFSPLATREILRDEEMYEVTTGINRADSDKLGRHG
jgi:hypothetical protein